MSALPLDGIVVLDFGQIFQGPYCTYLLARAGARVIKIEPPGGEPLRRRAEPGKTQIFSFAMLNGCKEAVTLNLKSPEGKALLLRMAERADILLENFSPGTMDGLGVGYDTLAAVNPALIYATGSGFGISGPDRDNLAMDFTIQAASGIMSVTGAPDGPPMKAGPTLVDMMGGIHLYGAIMTALFHRTHNGRGQKVEVAMQETVYPALASPMEYRVRTGKVPPRAGNRQAALNSAPYNAYRAADGWVAIHVVTEAHWRNLLAAMGQQALAEDPRFATNPARVANMEAVDALVTEWTSRLGRYEIFAITKRLRIPCAPVRDVAEVMEDPHMHARGFLRRITHPEFGEVVMPMSSLRLHGAAEPEYRPSPAPGQDNAAVYCRWLGLEPAELARLSAGGVI